MKKLILICSLLVVVMFLISCSPKPQMTDEELDKELNSLSPEEKKIVLSEDKTALSGQVSKQFPKLVPLKRELVARRSIIASSGAGCSDTDGGINLTVKGSLNSKNSIDNCLNKDILKEYDCGWLGGITKSCHSGNGACSYSCSEKLGSDYVCLDGACVVNCVPKQCVYQDNAGGIKDCGIQDDGCGGTINCNYQPYAGGVECPTGYQCVNQDYVGGIKNQCVEIARPFGGCPQGVQTSACLNSTNILCSGYGNITDGVNHYWNVTLSCGGGLCIGEYPSARCN